MKMESPLIPEKHPVNIGELIEKKENVQKIFDRVVQIFDDFKEKDPEKIVDVARVYVGADLLDNNNELSSTDTMEIQMLVTPIIRSIVNQLIIEEEEIESGE
jgi:hypothetical protein